MELQMAHKPQRRRRRGPGFGRGRPRLNPDLTIKHGVVVQPRFPRVLYREISQAAREQGVAITRWIIERCNEAIESKKKSP